MQHTSETTLQQRTINSNLWKHAILFVYSIYCWLEYKYFGANHHSARAVADIDAYARTRRLKRYVIIVNACHILCVRRPRGLSRSNLPPRSKVSPGASYFEVNRPHFEVFCPPSAFIVPCTGSESDISSCHEAPIRCMHNAQKYFSHG